MISYSWTYVCTLGHDEISDKDSEICILVIFAATIGQRRFENPFLV
jgi:hypothetical protein